MLDRAFFRHPVPRSLPLLLLAVCVLPPAVAGCGGSDSSEEVAPVADASVPDATDGSVASEAGEDVAEAAVDAAGEAAPDAAADAIPDVIAPDVTGDAFEEHDASVDAAEEPAPEESGVDAPADQEAAVEAASDVSVPPDSALEASVDAPAETSAEAAVDAPAETSAEAAVDAQADTSAEAAVDAPAETSAEAAVDAQADSSTPMCTSGIGFAAAGTPFSLPGGYAKGYYYGTSGDTYCDSYNGYGRPAYSTVDLTGDRKPDFVVTRTCGALEGSDPAVGKTSWRVYAHAGNGFAASFDWPLPQDYAKGYFYGLSGDTYCDSYNGYGRPAYQVMDLDGDAKADLLVTRTCSTLAGSDPTVGVAAWRLYKGTGAGFSTSPGNWPLPQEYAKGYFFGTSGDTYCDSYNGYGRPAYQLADMNGDQKLDLVVTRTCSTLAGSDPTVGVTRWRVYLNTGTGFAATPVDWALPQEYAKGYFNDLSGDTYCDSYNGYGRPAYTTVDVNGDHRPDLVVTRTCSTLAGSDPAVGVSRWRVYLNNGTGFFATPIDWALPSGYAKGYFYALSGDTYCDSYNGYGRPAYETLDLNGDQRPDMVVYRTCSTLAGSDPGVGVAYWTVYWNNGAGFDAQAEQWCLPQGYAKGYYYDSSGDTYCDSYNGYGRPKYETLDLTGSSARELVVTRTCSTLQGSDPDVGKTKWLAY